MSLCSPTSTTLTLLHGACIILSLIRFGTAAPSEDELLAKLKARKDRFGEATSEAAKKLEKYEKTQADIAAQKDLEEKKKARAARFATPSS